MRRATLVVFALSSLTFYGCDQGDAQAGEKPASQKQVETDKDKVPSPFGKDEPSEHPDAENKESSDEVSLTTEALVAFRLRLEPVSKRHLADEIVAPARVAFNADAIAHVGTTVQGRVAELKVMIGDQVKKGDELLVIDSPELGEAQNEFLQKRSAIIVSQTQVDIAKVAYERSKVLYESKAGPLGEFQKQEGTYRATQADFRNAETSARAAENKLRLLGMQDDATSALLKSGAISTRFAIRSPIAGDVIERAVTLGEVVGPDKEAIFTVADTSRVWVLADVPEAKLPEVRTNAKAIVKIAAMSDRSFDGQVTYISHSTNPQTRTGQVRIEVANPDRVLRSGMFAQTEIELSSPATEATASEALAVPEEAVQTIDGATVVFVPEGENEPGHFKKRPVSVGPAVGSMVPVFKGLKEGEQVVSVGSFVLKAELGKSSVEEE